MPTLKRRRVKLARRLRKVFKGLSLPESVKLAKLCLRGDEFQSPMYTLIQYDCGCCSMPGLRGPRGHTLESPELRRLVAGF